MASFIKTAPTLAELRQHRDEILQLAQRYGASDVRVFGSVARDEAAPDSDIDLWVSFPSNKSIFDLIGLWLDLKELLGREIDIVTDQAMRDHIRPNAMKDAVSL